MRRATAWVVAVGVAVLGTARPGSAADGFWVSVASGVAGSVVPSGYQDMWFETPHGPPPVAVTRLTNDTVEATTGGGSSFFSGGAVPVVLHTTDGSAYLAGGTKPSDLSAALKRQGGGASGLATAAPDASATTPPADALLLGADLGEPSANGARALNVTVTGADGATQLWQTAVTVPDGGWWVIGLGPGASDPPPGGGTGGGGGDPDPGTGGGGGGGGGGNPDPGTGGGNGGGTGGGGPVATPEPATGVLLGIGGLGAAGWRAVKRRRGK